MKIVKINAALKGLRKITQEIHCQNCFEEENFTSGFIAFRPQRNPDPKQINHNDKDVVCHVLKGRGRLRINGRRIPLRPGTICHIPKGTPHDFAAGKRAELVLFYSLIKTA
ncbi:MAG TPA: cupin domain-containing protein [Methylomirabilota bacterium]|nr:cupin domain-containing protein [Methylomirabilota bacterium]